LTLTIEEKITVPFEFNYPEIAKKVIIEASACENFPYEAEINLLLVDDEIIRTINNTYRGIDKATDVLSFPMIEYEVSGEFSQIEKDSEDNFNPDTGELILGDIIISIPKVLEQAEEYGHDAKREFAFLITHSMLHLFGYDHMKPEEAAIMENKQKAVLERLDITR